MSRAKILLPKQKSLLEEQSDLMYKIKGETLEKIAIFFNRFGYYFKDDILTFLNNPIIYHGKPDQLELIVKEFLGKIISDYYHELQGHTLPIKNVYDSIFNQIFRGKK